VDANSEPVKGGKMKINGEPYPSSSVSLSFSKGVYTIKASAQGYQPSEKEINVTEAVPIEQHVPQASPTGAFLGGIVGAFASWWWLIVIGLLGAFGIRKFRERRKQPIITDLPGPHRGPVTNVKETEA